MAKFLLLIAVFIVVYMIIRGGRRRGEAAPGPAKQAEDMVRCKVCGVHLPRSESVTSLGEFFCSQEHLRLADKRPPQD